MPHEIAQAIVTAFEVYVLAGVGFALLFVPRALARLDPRVAGAPRMLRLVILPGIVALWPLFARRWAVGAREPVEDNPHRSTARGYAGIAGRPKELAR